MRVITFTIGLPVARVCFIGQAVSQMLVRKTSPQGRPIASMLRTRVIFSAARLKEVISQFKSTVKTPSLIEFRMVSWCLLTIFEAKAAPSRKELHFTRVYYF
ncbi:uncharacterized protein Dvar_84500 [Desulfosarcina variabilis str. Montpellier]